MREQLLIRHFLRRLLEHDLVSPNSDRHSVLSATGGTLVALSLALAVFTAARYQFDNFMPPGITSMLALDDRFLFVSASMLIAALAATAEWNALVLEPRDAAILGVLPVPTGVIVRAKCAATAIFALAVIGGWNLLPTLARVATLPIGLRVGWIGIAQLMFAHAAATVAAGAFGFLAVLCLREITCATLGPSRFLRVSGGLQAALIVGLSTALLLLPTTYSSSGSRWLASDSLSSKMVPAFWFVGVNEMLAGSVINDLPHVQPRERMLIVPEEIATRVYRSLWPVYARQARTAMVALLMVGVGAIAATVWNSRRLTSIAARARRGTWLRDRYRRLAPRAVATASLRQAGFSFALQTLSRRVTHRVALATATAIGLALVTVSAGGHQFARDTQTWSSIPVALLAAQFLLVGSALSGFRHATRLPSELRGSLTFSLAWSGRSAPYISGIKRAGWFVAMPSLALASIWHVATLGWPLAALQFGVGAAYASVLLQALFFRNRLLPLASAYVPSDDAKMQFVMHGGALLTTSLVLASIERLCLDSPSSYAGLLVALLLVGLAIQRIDRVSSRRPLVIDLDGEASLPTQRLGLQS